MLQKFETFSLKQKGLSNQSSTNFNDIKICFFSLRLRAALPPTEKDIKTTDDSFIFCATFLIDKLLHVFSQTNVNGVFVVFKLQLSNHIMEECPKTCEQCVYHDIGCAFQVIYISWVSKLCRFVLFRFFLLCFLPLVMISYYK